MANRSTDQAVRGERAGLARAVASKPWRWSARLAVVVVVAAVAALTAQTPAPDRSAADAAAQRAAERIRALQRESDSLAKQERTLLVELRKLEVERALRTEELTAVERQLQATRA